MTTGFDAANVNENGNNVQYLASQFVTDSIYKLAVAKNHEAIMYVPTEHIDLDLVKMAYDKTTVPKHKSTST
jgi:hypothetical protein